MCHYYVRDHNSEAEDAELVFSGIANNPEEACIFADIEKYGNEKSKRFSYEKTHYTDDAKYIVSHFQHPKGDISEEEKYKFLSIGIDITEPVEIRDGYFKRVRITRFPWLGNKIWDIVKIIVSALAGFMLAKFLQ